MDPESGGPAPEETGNFSPTPDDELSPIIGNRQELSPRATPENMGQPLTSTAGGGGAEQNSGQRGETKENPPLSEAPPQPETPPAAVIDNRRELPPPEWMDLMRGRGSYPRELEGWNEEQQREWMWGVLIRIADTGTRFGASENYADAVMISSARQALKDEICIELDSLLLIYNQFVAFSTAPSAESGYNQIENIQARHYNALFHRPEMANAFQLWEKFSIDPNLDILNKKGSDLARIKGFIGPDGNINNRDSLLAQLKVSLDSQRDYGSSLLAARFALRFGEYLWRINERAALLDKGLGGSGEYFIRRLFYGGEAILKAMNEGLNQAKPEVARRVNFHLKDIFSEFGEKFWMGTKKDDSSIEGGQSEEVKRWYLRMKQEGKFDEESRFTDLSECPFHLIDFSVETANPAGGLLVGHKALKVLPADKTRSTLLETGGFLEKPIAENFVKLKGLFSNLNFATEKSQEEKEKTQKQNAAAKLLHRPEEIKPVPVFRQEAFEELLRGMKEHLIKSRGIRGYLPFNKGMGKEVMADYISIAANPEFEMIGNKEKNQLMKELFPVLPYWIEIPLRKTRFWAGVLKTIWEILKAGSSQK